MTPGTYDRALARLPEKYGRALTLNNAGVPTDEICRQLSIEPDALEALLEIARRKLRTLLCDRSATAE
ncbi:MAG: hypothetical protein JST91_01890 [Actinobacteria bacterium]|nr:hypothetical protein [Actinomycetota bacterium]